MRLCCSRLYFGFLVSVVAAAALPSQTQSSSTSNPHPSQKARRMGHPDFSVDAGSVNGGVYRNSGLGLSCKVPAGWVLRTEEMNAREEEQSKGSGNADPEGDVARSSEEKNRAALDRTAEGGCPHTDSCGGRVLLAEFSRPPEAAGEDVNSSILIVAESVAAYPGLKEAAQYFGPVSEVAKAQGFKVVEEPYEF